MNPIIKWVGGKRWLVPVLQKIWQPYQEKKLVEPFMGGLSIALGLNPKLALLNDANVHLVNFYQQIKNGLKVNIELKNEKTFFYEVREEFNRLIQTGNYKTKKAAIIFYYLIRTGYNGLCRFNSSGIFNVPFGSHTVRYRKDFLDYKEVLKNWELRSGDFEALPLSGNEFLYVDPPYDVEFTKYSEKDFLWEDQKRLADWLSLHKGPVVASNQATTRILELYEANGFTIFTLAAPRRISCTGDREPALEMLALKGFTSSFTKNIAKELASST